MKRKKRKRSLKVGTPTHDAREIETVTSIDKAVGSLDA